MTAKRVASERSLWRVAGIATLVLISSLLATRAVATQAKPVAAPQGGGSSLAEVTAPALPASVSADNGRLVAAEVPSELERRFNDLRREFLDLEAQAVNRWLTVLAIILTVMGVLVPIAGVLGIRRFLEIERNVSEIEQNARTVLKEIRSHEQEAKQHVEKIRAHS